MEEKIQEMVELLEREPTFRNELENMNAEEAIAALAAKGVNITFEDMTEIAKAHPVQEEQGEELTAEDLEDVTGGCGLLRWIIITIIKWVHGVLHYYQKKVLA